MVSIKPLANISEKVANYVKIAGKESVLQTMPVKSTFKGLKLAPLQKDTMALTPAPKKYASQGERLKDFYNSKGFPYLLPNQEWSDKKILDTIGLLGKDLDILTETNKLNKKSVQKTIEKLIPEVKGKVIIKDFSDLKRDLQSFGLSFEDIKIYMQYNAFVSSGTENSCIYLKFEQLKEGKLGQTLVKKSVEHELKHALSARLQNTQVTDFYKNVDYKCDNQAGIFNKTFSLFEKTYNIPVDLDRTKLTQKKLLDRLGLKSAKDLYKNFDISLNKIIKDEKATGELNIGNDKKSWKQFFNYLKNKAKDEKEAYQSTKRLREISEDTYQPTTSELIPLLYEEMEKFFAQKRIQIKKGIAS